MSKTLVPDGVKHVIGAPLFEINYVTIHLNDEKNLDPLEVHGTIRITNGRGVIIYLYSQSKVEPDRIFSGERLWINDIPPTYSPFPITQIDFDLIDKTKGLVLAKDTLTLDYTDKNINFEEKGDKTLYGKDGYVKVSYTTFESAVMAEFHFKLCKKNVLDESGGDDVVVVGRVEASYDTKYKFVKPFKATFLSAHDPLPVTNGQFMPMLKSQTAVPACCSSANISASLKISTSTGDMMIDGSVTCPVRNIGFNRYEIMGAGDYFIYVYVNWMPGNDSEKLQPQVTQYVPQPSSRVREPHLLPAQLSEVYSFVIIPDEKKHLNEVLNLHGQVNIDKFCLFERAEGCPISFRRGQVKTFTLNIPFRHWSNLHVKLMDTQGRIFCEGFISWYPDFEKGKFASRAVKRRTANYSWYDRFLCSTIKGDYGLVKVYHSIFEHAVPAIVNVLSYFDDPSRTLDTDISGSIFSSYSKYVYETPYYKDHFRNVLFSENRGSCSKISVGCKKQLPLLKSEIAVPDDSDLVIELDLCLSLEVDSPVRDTFKEVVPFKVGCGGSHKIRRKDFVLEVSVYWLQL